MIRIFSLAVTLLNSKSKIENMTPKLGAFFLIALQCDILILEAIDRAIRESCNVVSRGSSIYIGRDFVAHANGNIRLLFWSNGSKIQQQNKIWFWTK